MNALDKVFSELHKFSHNEITNKMIDELHKLLKTANRFNFNAMINVTNIEKVERDIGELEYPTDYEIITGSYQDEDGEEYTRDEWDEKLKKIEEDIARTKDAINTRESSDKLPKEADKPFFDLEDELMDLRAKKEILEDAEFEYDEIYWNTVTRYRGNVNIELAQRLRLGVLEINDEQYMFLRSCGMDLSGKYIAYQALEFGAIDPSFVYKFRDMDFLKYVMGEKIFKEVIKILGIEECIETARQEIEERMKKFDDKLNKITELRNSGKLDKNSAGLLAMMAYDQSKL